MLVDIFTHTDKKNITAPNQPDNLSSLAPSRNLISGWNVGRSWSETTPGHDPRAPGKLLSLRHDGKLLFDRLRGGCLRWWRFSDFSDRRNKN